MGHNFMRRRALMLIKQHRWQEINLGLGTRPLGEPSNTAYDAASKRTWNPSTYVKGISHDNYYLPAHITNLRFSSNSVSVNGDSSGYGVGFPISVSPGETYRFSVSVNPSNADVGIVFYKADGTWTGSTGTQNQIVFSTPADAAYVIIIFTVRAYTPATTFVYSNIMLEKLV